MLLKLTVMLIALQDHRSILNITSGDFMKLDTSEEEEQENAKKEKWEDAFKIGDGPELRRGEVIALFREF